MRSGIDKETATAMAGSEAAPLELPGCRRAVIELFLASAGQWRMAQAGMAGTVPVALDLGAVRQAAEALAIDWTRGLIRDLQVLEAEALALFRAARA